MAVPPTPFHILRAHHAPISALHLSNDSLYAGDQDGVVSVTDLQARRVVAAWKAHEGGVLGVGGWEGGVVSQGRDNTLNFYAPLTARPTTGAGPSDTPPEIQTSMPSNALNFCRFSLAHLSQPMSRKGKGRARAEEVEGLMALPGLTDSELVDIYALPSTKRIAAAVNFLPRPKGVDAPRTGLVMALHVAIIGAPPVSYNERPSTSVTGEATIEEISEDYPPSQSERSVGLVVGYEDGRVEVWTTPLAALLNLTTESDGRKGTTWTRMWEAKGHNEAVMAMTVDNAFTRAFTVSADHLIVRIDLAAILTGQDGEVIKKYPSKNIGYSSLAVSSDGRILAAGGWDGKIRLFSAATLKPLGTLAFHRESVQAMVFGHPPAAEEDGDEDVTIELGADSDSEDEDELDTQKWLISGGKDRRIALWKIDL